MDLAEELSAGESTEVELDVTLTLGAGFFERFGTDTGVSWWASGAPLLAWEPGVGWARDAFVGLSGETTRSPAAATTVQVSAPAELSVLTTGAQEPPSEPRDGRRTWWSSEPVARDVAVAVGDFSTAERVVPGGVRVRAGALPGGRARARGAARAHDRPPHPAQQQYVARAYDKGGAKLLAAREASGAAAFDAALRCYVDAAAWRISTPRDVGTASADLPAALDVLVRAGALDENGLPG